MKHASLMLEHDDDDRNTSSSPPTMYKFEELIRNKTHLQNAQHLMLDGNVDAKDYKDIKTKIESSILQAFE